MLAVPGTIGKLCGIGPCIPLLQADQLLFFGNDNVEPCERKLIEDLHLREVRLAQVAADPAGSAADVASGWARRFDRLLVHLDVDILDFADTPLAENTRRHVGLRFDQLIPALGALLAAPNFCALTVCELNPDHAESDGSTLANFGEALADCFARSGHW
jgi:arginase